MSKLPKAVKHESTCVECGVEPMPDFPLLLLTRFTNEPGRGVHLIYRRDELNTLTDNDIKDMVYRRKRIVSPSTHSVMMLTDCQDISVDSAGALTFMAQKGMSGESSLYMF